MQVFGEFGVREWTAKPGAAPEQERHQHDEPCDQKDEPARAPRKALLAGSCGGRGKGLGCHEDARILAYLRVPSCPLWLRAFDHRGHKGSQRSEQSHLRFALSAVYDAATI